jgi:hypothetical protein
MYIFFLDLTITHKQTTLEIGLYRKQSTTDATINFLSNHPIEYKMAAFRHHISRMCSLPPTPKKKKKGINKLIARNNKFPQNLLQKLNRQIQHKTVHVQTKGRGDKKIWTVLAYCSPQIKKKSPTYSNTNIGIAFRNTGTL